MKDKIFPKVPTLVLVITNDSTVFLKDGICSAYELFGGRCQEVKNLVRDLDLAKKEDGTPLCTVSFGIISSRYGFIPADYTVMKYPAEEVASTPEMYEDLQLRKDFIGTIFKTTSTFDRIILCLPRHMVEMILDADVLPEGRVIVVTSPALKERVEAKDWMFLERKGARLGNENRDIIMDEIVRLSKF